MVYQTGMLWMIGHWLHSIQLPFQPHRIGAVSLRDPAKQIRYGYLSTSVIMWRHKSTLLCVPSASDGDFHKRLRSKIYEDNSLVRIVASEVVFGHNTASSSVAGASSCLPQKQLALPQPCMPAIQSWTYICGSKFCAIHRPPLIISCGKYSQTRRNAWGDG